MITLKLMGGLGNQMFQYAAARNISLITGEKLIIDTSFLSGQGHETFSLNHCHISDVTITNKITFSDKLKVKAYYTLISKKENDLERHMKEIKYQPFFNKIGLYCVTDGYIALKTASKNKLLCGYFQSEKYFKQNNSIIRQELLIKDDVPPELLKSIKANNSVCVHIRRGDYLKLTNYLVCDIAYYKKAISIMQQQLGKCQFYIFSDDNTWAQKALDNTTYIFVQTSSPFQDLKLMYHCQNFILSNSSFSWWGWYLSNNHKSIVIAPNQWYNDIKKNSDLIMSNFILLDKNSKWKQLS